MVLHLPISASERHLQSGTSCRTSHVITLHQLHLALSTPNKHKVNRRLTANVAVTAVITMSTLRASRLLYRARHDGRGKHRNRFSPEIPIILRNSFVMMLGVLSKIYISFEI
jgi:hypothetical protein